MAEFIKFTENASTRISSIHTITVADNVVRLHAGDRSYDLVMVNSGETVEKVAARLAIAQKYPQITVTVQEVFESKVYEQDLFSS